MSTTFAALRKKRRAKCREPSLSAAAAGDSIAEHQKSTGVRKPTLLSAQPTQGGQVRGRPGRSRSSNPASRSMKNRFLHTHPCKLLCFSLNNPLRCFGRRQELRLTRRRRSGSSAAHRSGAAGEKPAIAVVYYKEWKGGILVGLRTLIGAALLAQLGCDYTASLDANLDLETLLVHIGERFQGDLFLILDRFEEYFLYHPIATPDVFASQFANATNHRGLPAHFLISLQVTTVWALTTSRMCRGAPPTWTTVSEFSNCTRWLVAHLVPSPTGDLRAMRDGAAPVSGFWVRFWVASGIRASWRNCGIAASAAVRRRCARHWRELTTRSICWRARVIVKAYVKGWFEATRLPEIAIDTRGGIAESTGTSTYGRRGRGEEFGPSESGRRWRTVCSLTK